MSYTNYFEKLRALHSKDLGYPYNLDFDMRFATEGLSLLINNLGDPYIPSNYASDSRIYEQAVIEFFLKLWRFEGEWGYVTSSGTEGNLAGILYGKCVLPGAHIVYSEASHYSVPKAAIAYGLKSILVPVDENGEIDYLKAKSLIERSGASSLIFVANISTTFSGAFDSPLKIIDIAARCGISRSDLYIHGDGALGGMILPFLDSGLECPISSGVYDSVSASGHKMPGSPLPSGVIVTKKSHMERFAQKIEYLNSVDSTLGGSRSGLAALLLHESLVMSGIDAWRAKIHRCLNSAERLKSSLCEAGIQATRNRNSNTVVFPRPSLEIVNEWQLACQGNRAHAIVMPNHSDSLLDEFVQSYLSNQIRERALA